VIPVSASKGELETGDVSSIARIPSKLGLPGKVHVTESVVDALGALAYANAEFPTAPS